MRSSLALTLSLLAVSGSADAASLITVTMTDPGLVDEGFAAEVQTLSTTRAVDYLQLVGEGMIEQAFTLQHASPQGSALLRGPQGLEVGVVLDTFPLESPVRNLMGKTENTKYSPVLPRFDVGASGTWDRTRWRLGWSWTPPLTVGGATAQVVGVDASFSRPAGERAHVGVEIDYSNGHAIAPVAATKEQYEAGQLSNVPEERWEEICAPQEYGCLDTLTLRHGGVRFGASMDVGERLTPAVELGLLRVWETFDVQSDLSSYLMTGFTPTAGVTLGASLHPALRSAVGISTAVRPQAVSTGSPGVLYRIEVGVGYVF